MGRIPNTNRHRGADSRLVEQPRRNVTHVLLLELVILAVIFVDACELEGGYHGWDVEAHGGEAIYQSLVVAVVSIQC